MLSMKKSKVTWQLLVNFWLFVRKLRTGLLTKLWFQTDIVHLKLRVKSQKLCWSLSKIVKLKSHCFVSYIFCPIFQTVDTVFWLNRYLKRVCLCWPLNRPFYFYFKNSQVWEISNSSCVFSIVGIRPVISHCHRKVNSIWTLSHALQ